MLDLGAKIYCDIKFLDLYHHVKSRSVDATVEFDGEHFVFERLFSVYVSVAILARVSQFVCEMWVESTFNLVDRRPGVPIAVGL